MIKYLDDFKKIISMFGIAHEHVCFVTSVALAVNDIRMNNDLEFVLKPYARKNLEQLCDKAMCNQYSGFIRLNDIMSCVINPYQLFGISDEALFLDEYSTQIGDFRVVNLELYIAKKILQNRKKDEEDIQLVRDTSFSTILFEEKVQKFIKLAVSKGYKYPIENREDLWNEIMKSDFYIFGTGYAGKNLYKRIKKEGRLKRLKGFIVSKKQKDDVMCDIPIYELNCIQNRKIMLLVAVEFCNMLEVIKTLRQKGFYNLIEAYMFWE